MKAPRDAFHSNDRSVPGTRELAFDWSGVVKEADDVVGGRFRVKEILQSYQ